MAGIYVHIPFCHAKCAYCDFFSTPCTDRAPDVVAGIISEYSARLDELGGEKISTVYFGGGTPSCLPQKMLSDIVAALPFENAVEKTIEVNPEDVNAENASFWRALGFNRVSMGVQSLNDAELAVVGRRHNSHEALDAIDTLRQAGFDNISCDLIYGLPAQTLESWKYSLATLLDKNIEHLSAYSLSYEPGTRLTAMLSAGKIKPVDDDTVADMYNVLCEEACARGFEHYEISNLAMPGRRSKHNSSYWDYTPYLGLGPGAHSLDSKGVRRACPTSIQRWLEQGAQVETETETDRLNDFIITGLRTADGLDLERIADSSIKNRILKSAATHLQTGAVVLAGSRLRIPERHWLISDAIMRDLIILSQ